MDNPKKNAEDYNDPTPYEAEKHIRAQIRGKQARLAGSYFEAMISGSCDYYLDRGLAKIEKTPEPMKPLGPKNYKGQFLACYTKQAQPDYKGTLKGGRAVVFEAKHTGDDRIEYNRLTKEQRDDLEHHHKLGAVAFVLVSMSLTECFRVPWTVWRDMAATYGRKYMTRDELLPYKVPVVAGFVKFLDKLPPEAITVKDLSPEELVAAGEIPYFNRNYVAPRLTEMKQMGILKTVGRRKATRSDATEAVWARVHTAAADQTAAAPADNPATGPEQMTLLGPGA